MVEELDELSLRQAVTYPYTGYSKEIRKRDMESNISPDEPSLTYLMLILDILRL